MLVLDVIVDLGGRLARRDEAVRMTPARHGAFDHHIDETVGSYVLVQRHPVHREGTEPHREAHDQALCEGSAVVHSHPRAGR